MKRRKRARKVSRKLAAYQHAKATSRPGQGKRFAALTSELEAKGAKNPAALSAWIGRRKYGKSKFQRLSARGR